jgi:hypothetical protein
MSSFDDQLWSELARDHGAPLARAQSRVRPGRRRSARRTLAAGGASLVVAAAVILAVSLNTATTSPAYAVVVNPDGTVTVTLKQLLGRTGANARLASLGVPVRVVTREAGCTAKSERTPLAEGTERGLLSIATAQASGGVGAAAIRIHPHVIPAGETVIITARAITGPKGGRPSHAIGLSAGFYRDPAPSCLPDE